MLAEAKPAGLSSRARFVVSSGRCIVQSGTLSFAKGRTCPAIQSVMCNRAGYCPVRIAARVGEQTVQAEYAWVNRIPCEASRSMFGVS